jgi:hypothetical protein
MMGHAKIEYEDAQSHYMDGRYELAAEAFMLAYEYQKLPQFLYNAGAAHHMRGKKTRDATALREAVALYRRYLVEDPTAKDRDAVLGAVAEIEKTMAAIEATRR